MSMDQAHEQINKIIITDGGAIGIINNEEALLEWAVAGPQIVEMLQDVYAFDEENDEGFRHHHEDTDAFESKFHEDGDKLFNAFLEFGNPFEEEGSYPIHLTTKFVLGDNVAKLTRDAETIGRKQSSQFVTDRLIERTKSLYDVIH